MTRLGIHRFVLAFWLLNCVVAGHEAGAEIPLRQLAEGVYHTEHCLFLVDTAGALGWPSYDSVFSAENRDSYAARLLEWFPDDYMTITLIANDLVPNRVPVYEARRAKPGGIGMDFGTEGVADQCVYNVGGGRITSEALAVWDHEIGHAFGLVIPPSDGHWLSNATVRGQMAAFHSDDGFETAKVIVGNPQEGFRWHPIDLWAENQKQKYSPQTLYAMGLEPRFPTTWLLEDPVYNADHSLSYSSLARFDHASTVAALGRRAPNYRRSDKRFRVGFVFVVRDEEELQRSYEGMEQSIAYQCGGTKLDRVAHLLQVPFLVATHFRASLDCRLADLDGNAAPELHIATPHRRILRGESASIRYQASDDDGSLRLRCLRRPGACDVRDNEIIVSGLQRGSHFFTVEARDRGGKTVYGHFVVDVR